VGNQEQLVNGGRSTTAVFAVAVPGAAATGASALSATASYTVPGGPQRTLASASTVTAAPAPPQAPTVLSHHPWFVATSGWMTPTVDASVVSRWFANSEVTAEEYSRTRYLWRCAGR
jgi:alpha-galactosidase